MSAPLSQKGSWRAFALMLLFMASALPAEAGSVWLMWDSNSEQDLKGYVVLWGTASGSYTGLIDVGARTSASVPNLKEGARYYFAVRAYNESGLISAPSGEVSAVVSDDANNNGLPDSWERQYGLDSLETTSTSMRNADPDRDGVPNHLEYQRGTHPRGTEVQYLPEGVQSRTFWNTRLALLNPGTLPAKVIVVFERADGQIVTKPLDLAARERTTVSAATFDQLDGVDFATRVESDVPLVVDRTVSWDSTAYGAHAETGMAEPARRWYITEGATSPFWLFYLIQNPDERAAQVRVTYLLESGEPERRTYDLAPHSRKTIFVNSESQRLAATPVSGVIESVNGVPVIAEHAMYYDAPRKPWAAGSASAGVTDASSRWYFAEGVANGWFDLFYLLANPGNEAITVRATYSLPDGGRVQRSYEVPPRRRRTIHVNADRQLRNTTSSVRLASRDGQPFLAERSLWWPRGNWYESNSSNGIKAPGTRWAIADGESGGPRSTSTFVLAANTAAADTSVEITLMFEGGGEVSRQKRLPANSRTSWDIGEEFPGAMGRRYGILVETSGAPIVVERSTYWNSGGLALGAGTSAAAVRLTP